MRVVDIINLSTSADTLLRDRVLSLRAAGIDDRIVCIDGPRVAPLRARGIPVHTVHLPRSLHPYWLLVSLVEITAYLRRNRVDVVHTHCSVPGAVGRVAAWLAGVPVVVHTVHGFSFHERSPRLQRWFYVAVERAVGLVTDRLLSQNWGDLELAERYDIGPRGRRSFIGNGIDLVRFHPRAWDPGPRPVPVVTCVARLEPIKNHRLLLQAAGHLARRGVGFRLQLVGDGPLRAEYQATCRSLGIADRVAFLGYREDMVQVLAGTDIAVLTSLKEGIPRAVLEAMGMGIPVVATRVPGTREAVRHGETGLLVDLANPLEFADALETLIADPALRQSLGSHGRQLAEEEFDEREMVAALEKLYRAETPVVAIEQPRAEVAGIYGDAIEARRRQ